MKSIIFITTNKHKVEEVQAVLKDYDIKVEQQTLEYTEDKEADMKEVCEKAAKELANELNKPIIVEDTGLFFKAYNNFPGALPKFVIQSIGFEGVFRLLKDKDKSAYFKTVVGYCEPNKEPILFEDEMHGQILDKVVDSEKDAMPYDHIFMPDGYKKAIVEMSMAEKNSFSQRGKVAKKLGEYLNNPTNY